MIEQITWKEARPLLEKGDPELLQIFDELSPGKGLPFIKVRYPFGSNIKDGDTIKLPNGLGDTEPLDGPNIDAKWAEQLGYSAVPLGMLVHNSIELFRPLEDSIFSLFIVRPNNGLQIGVGEHFGSKNVFSVSAGARSLYMVPRISNQQAHRKLQRQYGIDLPAPKHVMDHCALFKQIYEASKPDCPWYCEVVFLARPWIEQLKDSGKDWLRLKSYIQSRALMLGMLGQRKVVLEMLWQEASEVLTAKGLKPSPYVVDTLKHLLMVGVCGICGSRPYEGGDTLGPLGEIQRVYTDDYNLQGQLPTIMTPYSLMPRLGQPKPVYYSMQSPGMITSTPNIKVTRSIIDDMRELIDIAQIVLDQKYKDLSIFNGETMVDINDRLKAINIEYFHEETYAYGKTIRPLQEMISSDPDWGYISPEAQSPCDDFAYNGAFVRGCIKLSRSDDQ